MDAFAIMGFTFGMTGFVFGIIGFIFGVIGSNQVKELERRIDDLEGKS